MSQYPRTRSHPHNWTWRQLEERGGQEERGGERGDEVGTAACNSEWFFPCDLYWNATPVLSNRVILYMVYLLNISQWGGEGGVCVCCPLFFFFFLRAKASNVSSGLIIITDQLLIKIKWSFLNFNTVLQIMQKTQLIALLVKITFKNSSAQRTKII